MNKAYSFFRSFITRLSYGSQLLFVVVRFLSIVVYPMHANYICGQCFLLARTDSTPLPYLFAHTRMHSHTQCDVIESAQSWKTLPFDETKPKVVADE